MEIALRIGGIVAPVYIDDATILAAPGGLKDATDVYEALSECLGLELSDKPESNQESTEKDLVKTLGINYIWSDKGDQRTIRAEVPEEQYGKLDDAVKKLRKQLDRRELVRKDIESMLGLANYVVLAQQMRAGAELLRGLYDWATEEGFRRNVKCRNLRNSLARTLDAIAKLAGKRRPIRFVPRERTRERVWMLTDASSDGGPKGEAMIATLAFTEDGRIWVTSATADGNKRIEELEAAAVEMGAATFQHLLKGKECVVEVDNLTTLYAFLKCSSKSAATQTVVVRTIEHWYNTDVRPFYQFVPSEENIADWYTRVDKQPFADKHLRPTQLRPILTVASSSCRARPQPPACSDGKRRRTGASDLTP
jgi:hypothetical protein